MGPKSRDCPNKRKEKENQDRGEGHVRTEAGTGAVALQTKEPQGLPAAWSSQERSMEPILLPQTFREESTWLITKFRLLSSRAVQEQVSVVFNHMY